MAPSPEFEEIMSLIKNLRDHVDELHEMNHKLKALIDQQRDLIEHEHGINEGLLAQNARQIDLNEGVQTLNKALCCKVKHLEIQLKSWVDYAAQFGLEGPDGYPAVGEGKSDQ